MGKVLAIGDIHTKSWIIDAVRRVIDNYDSIVFCGDYADTWGPSAGDTIATWYALAELQADYPNKVKPVLGNHDYIYVHRTTSLQPGYNPATQIFIDAPENATLRVWLSSMPITLELDGVTYSHAGIDQRWNGGYTTDDIWNDFSPIWVRPSYAQYKQIPMVFGHTPQKTVTELVPGAWAIDTFSTYPDGTPIGDGTVLEVTNGTVFTPVSLVQ